MCVLCEIVVNVYFTLSVSLGVISSTTDKARIPIVWVFVNFCLVFGYNFLLIYLQYGRVSFISYKTWAMVRLDSTLLRAIPDKCGS